MKDKRIVVVVPLRTGVVAPSLKSESRRVLDWTPPGIVWMPYRDLGSLWGGGKR